MLRCLSPFSLVLGLVLLGLVLLAACGEQAPVGGSGAAPDPVAALAGGNPVPARDMSIFFPWMGKQSVMCVGEAFERQIAFADFSDVEGNPDAIGKVVLSADGTGSGAFTIPCAKLRTGDDGRNEKLLGGGWLDADTHPDIGLEIKQLERRAPTVWNVRGTWTMRGVTSEVEFLANVRWMEKMKYVSDHGVVRIKGAFPINLKHHGMDNGSVGTPAVAEVWTVQVVLLGVPSKA